MKKLLGLLLTGLLFISCEQTTNNTAAVEDTTPTIGVLKTTSGTTAQGSYVVTINQDYDDSTKVTTRLCGYTLTKTDGYTCGFAIVKYIKADETTYKVLIGIKNTNILVAEDFNIIYLTAGTVPITLTGALENIEITSDGSYKYMIVANISLSNLEIMKNQVVATVSVQGNKTVSFQIPEDWFFYLKMYW